MESKLLEDYFVEVRAKIDKGILPEAITTRDLLNKLNVTRRGSNVNACINELLEKYRLIIEPDYEWEYVDNDIEIKSCENQKIDYLTNYRIDGLKSANTPPISIKPEENLSKAITIMITKNYSQVPVISNDNLVKGVLTWKSISKKIYNKSETMLVNKYMDKAVIIDDDTSLFDAIDIISNDDYVLIRNSKDSLIKGIVTASDLSQQFRYLSEPFLLVGRCEHLIRKLITCIFTIDELSSVKNSIDESRKISSIYDLTFGEYIRIFENKEYWKRLGLNVDRKYFLNLINKVRNIRNDIMHFDPNTSNEEQVNDIRELVQLLEYALNIKQLN